MKIVGEFKVVGIKPENNNKDSIILNDCGTTILYLHEDGTVRWKK